MAANSTKDVELTFAVGEFDVTLPPALLKNLLCASAYIRDHSLFLRTYFPSKGPPKIKLSNDIFSIPTLYILGGDISYVTKSIDLVKFTRACTYLIVEDSYIHKIFAKLQPFTCILNMNRSIVPAAYWCLYRCNYPQFGEFLLRIIGLRNYPFNPTQDMPYHIFKKTVRSALRCPRTRNIQSRVDEINDAIKECDDYYKKAYK